MLTPVRIGYPSPGGGSLAAWAAVETGAFRNRGLAVELVLFDGSASAVGGLLRGDIEFANIASPAVIEANLTVPGSDLVYLAGVLNSFSHILVGSPAIGEVRELRGRRLGARVSDADVLDLDLTLWSYLLRRAGLDPRTDARYVEVRSHQDLVNGVLSGSMDAAIIIPPHAFEAERRGARVILEGPSLGLPFQLGGLVASRAYAERHPEVARAAVGAYVDGVRSIKGDYELARDLVRSHGAVEHEETIARTADFFRAAFASPPYPSLDGIGNVLASLAERLPGAARSRAGDHVLLDFLRELAPRSV